MPILLSSESVSVGVTHLPLSAFPMLLERHLAWVRGTLLLEQRAAQSRNADFASEDDTKRFICDVCRWGGYAGIGGRIINQNNPSSLCAAFRVACNHLSNDPPFVLEALRAVNGLKQLQRVSFASKHLRFLRPDCCPVLDSVLSAWLDYPMSRNGYVQFASDCQEVARTLNTKLLPLPSSHGSTAWRVADVEMALFAHKQGWNRNR